MAERFYFSGRIEGGAGSLEGDQAHHAAHVMRCRPGDQLTLFDGCGKEFLAKVTEIDKRSLRFSILEFKPELPPLSPLIQVAACLPKGDRQKFMLEKLVELGVDKFVPLKSKRSVSLASPNAIQRFQKSIIEATKQCGRRSLMLLSEGLTVLELIANCHSHSSMKLLADPYAANSLTTFQLGTVSSVIVAVGPEGGFEEQEISSLLAEGWQPVRIGTSILRVETAAIAAAAILLSARDSQLPK